MRWWWQPSQPGEPNTQRAERRIPPPLGDRIQRGEAATRLLADPTFNEAFADLRHEAVQSWLKSNRDDVAKREEAWRITLALDLVISKLLTYQADGRMREERAREERAAEQKEPVRG